MTARRGGTAGPRMHAARVLIAAPAMIGSLLLLLLVLMSWAGRWEPVLLLTWLASAAAVFTPSGERVAVRWACGSVRPSARHRALLDPAWRQALERCQVDPADVDLYIQRSRAVNAYAAGGRSVALTTGAQSVFLEPRPIHASDTECVAALLAHELGHRDSHGTRLGLVTAWLDAPWRFAERLLLGVAVAIARRQPRCLLSALVVAVVVVAVVQAVQHGQPMTAAVLTFLAVAGVACPLADAALRRHDEFAADRYAARAGYGPALAAALRRLDDGSEHRRRGLLERATARHPSIEQRLDALYDLDIGSCANLQVVTHERIAAPAPVAVTGTSSFSSDHCVLRVSPAWAADTMSAHVLTTTGGLPAPRLNEVTA